MNDEPPRVPYEQECMEEQANEQERWRKEQEAFKNWQYLHTIAGMGIIVFMVFMVWYLGSVAVAVFRYFYS